MLARTEVDSRTGCLLLFTALAVLGCAATKPPARFTDATRLSCTPSLAFLEAPHTSRAEVLARLGTPSSHWDDGRVLVYAIVRDSRDRFHVAWSEPGRQLPRSHHLILVFGESGRLERQALLPLGP
jgi:hypothetical protein